MGQDGYKYWAFISYSHQDRNWGDWLHKTLETYRVPSRLVGRESRDGRIPARLYPIFRDRDELPSSANLGDAINESLRESRYQIVICSPRAAASRWVNEEVKYFRSLGRDDRVLCLIVSGEPNVINVPGRDIEECFCPALRYPAEPIAADAREHADGKAGARLKLIAGLIGVGLDELIQRERQRQLWKKLQVAAAAAAFAGLCVGAWQWYVSQTAAREREIAIEKIVESGRLELLAGHEARAAVYLNEAYKMGHDTPALRFMLGQAMQVVEAVTNVRVVHGGDQVYRATFSPDGSKFALVVSQDRAGTESAVAKVYDARTGAELATLPEVPVLPIHVEFFDEGRRLLITGFPDSNQAGNPLSYVATIATPAQPIALEGMNGAAGAPLSPDGSWLLTVGATGLVSRDLRTGAQRWQAGDDVVAACYSPDGRHVAMASATGAIDVLDPATGRRVRSLAADPQTLAGLAFSPDGTKLVGFSRTGDIRLWDFASGRLQIAFAADRDRIHGLRFDASGRRFATIGTEGYKVWNAQRGVLILFVPAALNIYASADLSPDGNTLVTADYDNSVSEVWDVRSGRKLHSLDLHAGGISAAAFDADGSRLLLASRDGRAELWRMPVRPAWTYNSFETYPYTARFDREGGRLFAGGGDNATQGSVLIFDVATRELTRRLPGHKAVIYDLALGPAQDRLLTASRDGTGILWDLESGAALATLSSEPYKVSQTHYSPDGQRLLTIADPSDVHQPDGASLWDLEGRKVAMLEHAGGVIGGAFNATGSEIATGGFDGQVKIWDAGTGGLEAVLAGHRGYVRSVSFSRDARRVLSTSLDRSVRLWDRASGTTLRVLDDPALGVPIGAAFSGDEGQVAIGTEEGKVLLWWPESGRVATLKGHAQRVSGLRYSADDTLLFSASADGTVRAWDAEAGRELAQLAWHAASVNSLDLSPAGMLASASYSRLQLANVAPERRAADRIDALLKCSGAWTIDESGLAIRPRAPDPSACEGLGNPLE